MGELGTPPSRITANHPTVSLVVMAWLGLLTQEGRGEAAIHPLEPPCLDEDIAALDPHAEPKTASARNVAFSASEIQKSA